MIERKVFEDLVRDTLVNLYDFAALEAHPLALTIFSPSQSSPESPVEHTRTLFQEAVDLLKPPHKSPSASAPEWRAYWILQKRYFEGMDLRQLAAWLAISERQMRRDHHRAITALADLLWNRLHTGSAPPAPLQQVFQVKIEQHQADEIVASVLNTLNRRLEEQGLSIHYKPTRGDDCILTDRVVLRQLLISLIHAVLRIENASELTVATRAEKDQFIIQVAATETAAECDNAGSQAQVEMEQVAAWAEMIHARLAYPAGASPEYRVLLSKASRRTILVIDDQPPAVTLIQRILAPRRVDVIGANSLPEALEQIQSHEPDLIILDVMMPEIDGWETLQTLKVQEETRHIPVIICSAWVDIDLARSLGAAATLKKPVLSRTFFEALAQAGFYI